MDPLKTFEKRLLSGSLIDSSKMKINRPAWLCAQRVPKLYRSLEAMVTVPPAPNAPTGGASGSTASPLDTSLVYQLLLTSGLPQTILAALWDQCSRTTPGVLLQHEFYQALALVAICQKGHPPNPALLLSLAEAPLPQLYLLGYHQPGTPALQAIGPFPNPAAVSTDNGHHVTDAATHDKALHNGFTLMPNSNCMPMPNLESSLIPESSGRTSGIVVPPPQNQGTLPNHQELTTGIFEGNRIIEDDDDEFADFQSAPVGRSASDSSFAAVAGGLQEPPLMTGAAPSVDNGQASSSLSAVQAPSRSNYDASTSPDLFSFSCTSAGKNNMSSVENVSQDFPKHEQRETAPSAAVANSFVPKAKRSCPSKGPSAPVSKPVTMFSPMLPSLFDSMTVQLTEAVQPPSEPNPWLNYSLRDEEQAERQQQACESEKLTKKCSVESHEVSANGRVNKAAPFSNPASFESREADEESDDFADFQSAPSAAQCTVSAQANGVLRAGPNLCASTADRYSAFRALECRAEEQAAAAEKDAQENEEASKNGANSAETSPADNSETKVDILAMMKLPSIPPISIEDDLAILDSLTISCSAELKGSSALEELQDLDLGFAARDTQATASLDVSLPVSPTKSATSGGSIGEQRGNDRHLSLFCNRTDYSECASLSSFELGPNSESNDSSPTKGSILSLELNSPKRSPPEEEGEETLEWTVDNGPEQMTLTGADELEGPGQTTKPSDEFCWAQPPVFPPPDPTTDSNKPSSALQDLTDLCSYNYPETKVQVGNRCVSREQVAESWTRVLCKIAAILETSTHILGNDHGIVTEVLGTAKGHGYVACLLEVYNVSQQLKKAAQLFNVKGLSKYFEQVEDAWRRQLDDITVRLGLSVICLDHICEPGQGSDTCAVCLLPLSLRPRLLFGDCAYHSTCANFWANVLAEGLPCLKLDLCTRSELQ